MASRFLCDDILAETVDQTVHHFLAAVRRRDISAVARAALFINESLVEAAERSRYVAQLAGEESLRGDNAARRGGPANSLLPSLSQWVSSLDALATAALPAALGFMQQLHNTQPLAARSAGGAVTEDTGSEAKALLAASKSCLHVLVNLCFYTTVAFRRTRTQLAAVERADAARGRHRGSGTSSAARRNSGERDARVDGSSVLPDGFSTVEQMSRQMECIAEALRCAYTDYFPLLCLSADQQLWTIREAAVVDISGHPCLHDIPASATYLAEQDGWVWLLVTVVVSVLGPQHDAAARGHQSHAVATGRHGCASADGPPSPNSPRSTLAGTSMASRGGAASRQTGSAADTSVPSAHHPSIDTARTAASPGLGPRAAASTTVQPPATSAPVSASPLVVYLTRAGGVGGGDSPAQSDGGFVYATKYLTVVLSALGLFLKLWLKQRTVPVHAIDAWRRRTTRFSVLELSPAMVAQLTRDLEGPGGTGDAARGYDWRLTPMQDVILVTNCVTDLVSGCAALFESSGANLLELLLVLTVLVPVQTFYAAVVRQGQSMSEACREGEKGRVRVMPLVFKWRAVDRFCKAVSDLMYRISSDLLARILSPDTALPQGHRVARQHPLMPPEACTAILQLGLMHIIGESILAPRVPAAGAEGAWGSGTTLHTAVGQPPSSSASAPAAPPVLSSDINIANDPALRRYWLLWAHWFDVSYKAWMSGGTAVGASPNCIITSPQFPQFCAGFAQCVGAALEDVVAFLMVVKSMRGSGSPQNVLRHSALDLVAGVGMRRVRHVLGGLRDVSASLANTVLPGQALWRPHLALPFAALTEEAHNAVVLLLHRYEEIFTASNDEGRPGHRSYWLLAVAYLRLSNVEALDTAGSHTLGGSDRSHPFAAFEGMTDYVCAGLHDTIPFLQDRSYETYEEWLRKEEMDGRCHRQQRLQRGDGADAGGEDLFRWNAVFSRWINDPFQILQMEVKDACDVARVRLIMASSRFLVVALRLAMGDRRGGFPRITGPSQSSRKGSSRASTPSPSPVLAPAQRGKNDEAVPKRPPASVDGGKAGEPQDWSDAAAAAGASQVKVYCDAFVRFLFMIDSISSNRLMSFLRTFHEELRSNEAATIAGESVDGNGCTVASSATATITEADLDEAKLFEMEVALFFV